MKLVVIGATARTGLSLIQQALDKSYEVTAIMRSTENFPIQHEHLKAVEGNVLSVEFLTEYFQGCDAVLSCIGTRTYRTTIYSDSIKSITEAMKKAGVSRLLAITSWCTTDNPRDRGPFILEWILKPTILRNALADMAIMETYLNDSCPDINFTIVRPPELSKRPSEGKPLMVEVDRLHVPGSTNIIPREDVARFMLTSLDTDEYDRKMVSIGV
ncbi:flavin reductase (NADPH)-like [Apostichopus japonicus]|uniref:flavin reductase (NADPH)-like n=1 Tax=Stichopus japonicus TaxID=307972 RepID=UPI003AB49357